MAEENIKKETAKEILSRGQESQKRDSFAEKNEVKEREITPEEKIIREEINRELKLMDQDENLKKESENKAQHIKYLGEEEKIENLLKLAKEKGVIFAVKVAKDMKDPYILDIFHDILVREGLWKTFKE